MAGRNTHRRGLVAAVIAMLLVMMTACKSTAVGDAAVPQPAGAAPAAGSASDTRLCGTPPCMRFVSRGETRTLKATITDHPLISAVAVHVVGTVLCGGLLCLLGEGVSLTYIGNEARTAAQNNECLRVRILPNGHEWRLVDVSPSNQAPYCTD
jgi:hypothetical protein